MPKTPVSSKDTVSMATPMVYCDTSTGFVVEDLEEGREVVARMTPNVTRRTEACQMLC